LPTNQPAIGSAVATLQDKLAAGRRTLTSAGIDADEASIDIDVFARTLLGWDRARLLTDQSGSIPDTLEPRFSQWIERRARREPTAYIVGLREFWGLDFVVTPAVLIPRPETEFVVEEALRVATPTAHIADIGTGSGCIAVSLARELPDCRVVASDLSSEALAVAQLNATRHGVADRMTLVATSYLDDIAGPFDVIVANPPYVRLRDKPGLSPAVLHEPDVALFGGDTGLRDIAGVLDAALAKLRPGGWFVMEFGFGQEDDVRGLLATRPSLRLDHVRNDLQGLARTVIIQHVP
jgi:release factor glutamine methyltransferase